MWLPTSSSGSAGGYGSGALIFCSYILGVGVIVFVMTANQKFALLLTHLANTVEKLLPQIGLSGVILLSGMTLLTITRVHGKITEEHNAEHLYKCRRLCSAIIYCVIGACFVLLIHAYILEDSISWIPRAIMAAVNFIVLYAWLHYMHSHVLLLERAMAARGRGGRHGHRFRGHPGVTSVNVLPCEPGPLPLGSTDQFYIQNSQSPTDSSVTVAVTVQGTEGLAPPSYNEVLSMDSRSEYECTIDNRSSTPPPCYKDAESAKKQESGAN